MNFPPRLLLKVEIACPRLEKVSVNGDLREWRSVAPLPELCEMDGCEPFAEVKVTYNDGGFYVAARVEKTEPVQVHPGRPSTGDSLQLYLDTRATQDVHRATRFCHHFIVLPGKGKREGKCQVIQRALPNAREDAPMSAEGSVVAASRTTSLSYKLEAFLPTAALNGFLPEPGHRIGFTYMITSAEGGEQWWSAPPELPFDRDPSLWGVLVLE